MLELARRRNFHFDVVLFPINVMDAHFRSFLHHVAPVAEQMGVAVISMKPIGGGVILKSPTVTAPECLQFALNSPSRVVITGIDGQQILDQAFQAAANFRSLTERQVAAILAKTKQAAANGEYELFKRTAHFASTAKHPEWLGPDTPEVRPLAAT